ncbi:MAG: hypothetical protein JNJ59_13625 [Deltaproteobacteria bacterium]|nr:hypothetical protein [Deltaproteobacteria bacterium]
MKDSGTVVPGLRLADTRPPAGHRAGPRLASWFVAAALVLAGCGDRGTTGTSDPLGRARFALDLPNASIITRVDYRVRLTYLESIPPTPTIEQFFTTAQFGGELIAILPCTTAADGDGLNQVDITARIWVQGRTEPFDAAASSVFTCVRNADTPVNLVLNVIGQLDKGFVDIDAMVAGTLCSGKTDMKRDGYLGVCPQATCGGNDELFIFANTCEAVQAQEPTYWVCGDPADWQVTGNLANAYFPIPTHNGSWTFGVIALDVFTMAQADPSLTDAAGEVKVWAGLSASRAYFERVNGETTRKENAPFVYEFAAELTVPPRVAGQPAPELLMLIDQKVALGAEVTWQKRFGDCDEPARGVTLYPGLRAIDVRRDGNSAAKVILGVNSAAAPETYVATSVARCEAGWDEAATPPRPIITCGPPSPLL